MSSCYESCFSFLTKRVFGDECDCAFVKKTGNEGTLFGSLVGKDTSTSFSSKGDPKKGKFVYLIGSSSGKIIGEVTQLNIDSPTNPVVDSTVKYF